MPESTVSQQLVSLARASSRSAEALGRALVVIDDEDWQEQLRQTYPDRVELFEMCVRCLVAADTPPASIREALRQDVAMATPDQDSSIDEVLTTELVLETELQSALQRGDWRDGRMPEVLALHLLRSQSFRKECLSLAETAMPEVGVLVRHGSDGAAERIAA
jgi:hypothetical protein